MSKALYTILKVENFFKQTNFEERYQNQLFRIGYQLNTINRKIHIFNNYADEYIKWHNDKTSTPPMTKEEYLIETTTLLCSFGLAHYELLKKFFLEALSLDKMRKAYTKHDSRTQSSNKTTYGALVKLLRECPNFNVKMCEMLDVNFRNALAHDTWYLEDNQMRYTIPGGQQIKIPIKYIPQKIFTIIQVYGTITTNYFEYYEPNVVEDYNKIGSKKFNKIFPLYGMD